jgi:hypothetical protein
VNITVCCSLLRWIFWHVITNKRIQHSLGSVRVAFPSQITRAYLLPLGIEDTIEEDINKGKEIFSTEASPYGAQVLY